MSSPRHELSQELFPRQNRHLRRRAPSQRSLAKSASQKDANFSKVRSVTNVTQGIKHVAQPSGTGAGFNIHRAIQGAVSQRDLWPPEDYPQMLVRSLAPLLTDCLLLVAAFLCVRAPAGVSSCR